MLDQNSKQIDESKKIKAKKIEEKKIEAQEEKEKFFKIGADGSKSEMTKEEYESIVKKAEQY